MTFLISSLLEMTLFSGTTFFNTHMHKLTKHLWVENPTDHIDQSWSSLEEFWNFEDFTALYIKIDIAVPILLYLDQTPAKYLHLSCTFSPCHGACGLSNSLISSHIPVHLLLLTKPSSFCVTNTFQSHSQAVAVWSGKQAKKRTEMDLYVQMFFL